MHGNYLRLGKRQNSNSGSPNSPPADYFPGGENKKKEVVLQNPGPAESRTEERWPQIKGVSWFPGKLWVLCVIAVVFSSLAKTFG